MTLVALRFHKESSFRSRQVHSKLIKDKDKVFKKTTNFLGPNHRGNFRVTLNEINCSVKFLDFENKKLKGLFSTGFSQVYAYDFHH